CEPRAHRIGTRCAADDDIDVGIRVPARVAGKDDDDTVGHVRRDRRRPLDHRRATEMYELFGATETRPATGRDDDGETAHAAVLRHHAVSRVAKTMRPTAVGTTEVTCSITSGPPTRLSPPLTTTMDPSSRCPTP